MSACVDDGGPCLPVPVLTVVVLDACDDGSDRLAGQFGPDVHFVSVEAGNVGAARAAGFEYARSLCNRRSGPHLVRHHRRRQRGRRGLAAPHDRGRRRHGARRGAGARLAAFSRRGGTPLPAPISLERAGHNHIHGANMGFRADAYWHVGGFRALATGEDVELVARFESAGLRIHRDATLSVATSDRRDGRAPGGFASHLRNLSGSVRRRKADAS